MRLPGVPTCCCCFLEQETLLALLQSIQLLNGDLMLRGELPTQWMSDIIWERYQCSHSR